MLLKSFAHQMHQSLRQLGLLDADVVKLPFEAFSFPHFLKLDIPNHVEIFIDRQGVIQRGAQRLGTALNQKIDRHVDPCVGCWLRIYSKIVMPPSFSASMLSLVRWAT